MNNTKIKLLVSGKGWQEFDLSNTEELSKRNIVIDSFAKVGFQALIGDGAVIGYGAHIGYGAVIGCGAEIGFGAKISDNAKIGSGAVICSRAMVGPRAAIGDRAVIGCGAEIGYQAKISDDAVIGNDAVIGDRANPKTLFITGSKHAVIYWGQDIIQIGCIQLSIAHWKEGYEEIGSAKSYTELEIKEYGQYIDIVEKFHQATKAY